MTILKNKKFLISVGVIVLILCSIGGYFYFSQNEESVEVAQEEQVVVEEGKVVVYGDTRTGHDIHQKITDLIIAQEPGAVFHTGDLVDDGTVAAQWEKFNSINSKLRNITDFYAASGNHEKEAKLYYENFEFPGNEEWYSVDVNGIHFIILNSNEDISVGSTQYEWFEKDLNIVSEDIKYTAAIFHHPIYNVGRHEEDGGNLGGSALPLFKKYGVDIVFSGHDHAYERSYVDGIYHIVTGGGGAPLYDQARNSDYNQKYIKEYHYCILEIVDGALEVRVNNNVDDLIDEFVIT